jgi:hypothetical protein
MGNRLDKIEHQMNEICILCNGNKNKHRILCYDCMDDLDATNNDHSKKYKECFHETTKNLLNRSCQNCPYNFYNIYHTCKLCKNTYCDTCVITHIEYHMTITKITNYIISTNLICNDVIKNILIPYII